MNAEPSEIPVAGRRYVVRRARRDDVPAIVTLLADDALGASRDGVATAEDLAPYLTAFAAIDADPAHLLVVVEPPGGGPPVATLQLSVLPGLGRRGALRAQVEAVRVACHHRGGGLGGALITWAVGEARRRGAAVVQLTSDKRRADAHRFYARLGFQASHEGFKLQL